jgi:hypothetical protein
MKSLAISLILLSSIPVWAQQAADTLFRFDIPRPNYQPGKGPFLLLDEAHHNFHTTTGRFLPFCNFLRRDGYRVQGSTVSFTKEALKDARVLVIANALNAVNTENWSLPTPSAFTDDEIRVVEEWVRNGGSLFLIADHMPFPGSAEKLAAAFGFTFFNGFALRKATSEVSAEQAMMIPDIFTPGNGLQENAITRGRIPEEKVTSVRTFTGQAFKIPSKAKPLIVLDDHFELLLPKTAWEFNDSTSRISAAGFAQGASLEHGKGRLVVFGEAAMFSAQIQGDSFRMGMNAPDAKQNPQFLLNIIHWLDNKKK